MIDFVILNILYDRNCNIYEIKKIIDEKYSLFMKVSFGSIYPSLKKLEKKGCIKVQKSITSGGQRKSDYSITADGKNEFHFLMEQDLPENPPAAEQTINIKLIALLRENDSAKVSLIKKFIKYYELVKVSAERILKEKSVGNVCHESLIIATIQSYNEKIRVLNNLITKITM